MGVTLDGGSRSCCEMPKMDNEQEGKRWGAIAEGMLLPRTSCGVGTTTLTGTGTKQLEEETEREECTLFTNGLDPLSTPLTFALGWGS